MTAQATDSFLARPHPASYRDPESTVLVAGQRVLRGLRQTALQRYTAVGATGLFEKLIANGQLVGTRDCADKADSNLTEFAHVLEHEPVSFISYPYEWPFALLRRAALLHLDVQLRALALGVVLTDASAYNVQFRGAEPVFIDVGSFRPYVEGELWTAHRQFCEHFLNPLLLAADLGVPHHAWLRGEPEGLPTAQLAKLLPRHKWLSLRCAMHVLMPARAEARAARREGESMARIRSARMPREGYRLMLSQLRSWIEGLDARRIVGTTWREYSETRTYEAEETRVKRDIVREFAAWCHPQMLWDFGCNDGEFSAAALDGGAQHVIGLDADVGALERACERAVRDKLNFLPLYQDATNTSPGVGWRNHERSSLVDRARPDAVMALAFEHHLALGRNVPLDEVVDFLVALAPRGLIEFVPKSDPTVQRMLALKGDIFPDYTEDAFNKALSMRARIVRTNPVSSTGRTLYWFER